MTGVPFCDRFPLMNRKGFTLVEIIVIVALTVLLAAILLPSLKKVKEQSIKHAAAREKYESNPDALREGDLAVVVLSGATGQVLRVVGYGESFDLRMKYSLQKISFDASELKKSGAANHFEKESSPPGMVEPV